MLRGRQENVLGLKVDGEDDAPLARIETEYNLDQIQPQARQDFLKQTAKLFWLGKVRPQIEHSLLTENVLLPKQKQCRYLLKTFVIYCYLHQRVAVRLWVLTWYSYWCEIGCCKRCW